MKELLLASALVFNVNTGTTTLEDKDQNGIPDKIEDYYDAHIRDQYTFGISLGSLIGFASSLIGWGLIYYKNKKTHNYLIKENDRTSKKISELTEQVQSYKAIIDDKTNELAELTRENTLLATKIINANKEVVIAMNQYKRIDDKINTIVQNQLVFANYSEFVKEDIGTKVNNLVGTLYEEE